VVRDRVVRAMRRAGLSDEEIKAFEAEATDADYDVLLALTKAWVELE
jgi:hypothetical protein